MNKGNPLLKLQEYGQSIWLDYIRRSMIVGGELRELIEEDGLRGVTSNPKIFDKVIAGSNDYDSAISSMALGGRGVSEIYEELTAEDVRRAADEFRELFDASGGNHGFVSLEVNPHLAHDTARTVAEARRLWAAVGRPNALIKVPATSEGLPAIRTLISEGVNVNVTLLFGLPRYREVADAYCAGLEDRLGRGESLEGITSVASFFLSRIDVLVDPLLEELADTSGPKAAAAYELRGEVAIASARLAYEIYKEIFGSPRFARLAEGGAKPQRLLWASTSTKNPDYPDVKYVEALIGPETINTVPMETLMAYRDHGQPGLRLEEHVPEARRVFELLSDLGIDIDRVTEQLEEEGVEKFNKPFDSLMESLEAKRSRAMERSADPETFSLGDAKENVEAVLRNLEERKFVARLWRKDASLWSQNPEQQEGIRNAMGWLSVAEKMEEAVAGLERFATAIRDAGFREVVHMGMGGSSLAPRLFQRCFSPGERGLPLTVLDTTDPDTISALEDRLPLQKTLFIVASKSGTTAEARAFCDYFYDRLKVIRGEAAGENFVAITDPGTPLVKLARDRRFRRIFINFPDIGGRYSALSYFGMLPAALMGLDIGAILVRAQTMIRACESCVPARANPGLRLGAALGVLARDFGRDKLTLLMPRGMDTLAMWLEQLLAESTGKDGAGLLPVAQEPIADAAHYGEDRIFVHLELETEENPTLRAAVQSLKEAGRPVITIRMRDRLDVGQEFFRWELATATAGALLGINPFDQPDVQESKDATGRFLESAGGEERMPADVPVQVVSPDHEEELVESLGGFLQKAQRGDYLAILAYLSENVRVQSLLQEMRLAIRDALRVATTVGYGPRYLHSTGQLHKGGSNTGMFLELVSAIDRELRIPGRQYGFGHLMKAQGLADVETLHRRGRRVLRIDLGEKPVEGLEQLIHATRTALEAVHA